VCEDGTCNFILIYTHTHGDGKSENSESIYLVQHLIVSTAEVPEIKEILFENLINVILVQILQ
jgi:hypothetical protein